jgi:hypothetical protein
VTTKTIALMSATLARAQPDGHASHARPPCEPKPRALPISRPHSMMGAPLLSADSAR